MRADTCHLDAHRLRSRLSLRKLSQRTQAAARPLPWRSRAGYLSTKRDSLRVSAGVFTTLPTTVHTDPDIPLVPLGKDLTQMPSTRAPTYALAPTRLSLGRILAPSHGPGAKFSSLVVGQGSAPQTTTHPSHHRFTAKGIHAPSHLRCFVAAWRFLTQRQWKNPPTPKSLSACNRLLSRRSLGAVGPRVQHTRTYCDVLDCRQRSFHSWNLVQV